MPILLDETSQSSHEQPLDRRWAVARVRTPQVSSLSLISLLYALSLFLFYQQGFIEDTSFLYGASIVLGTVVFFYCVFKSGLHTRFSDATLMLPQILATISTVLLMAYFDRGTQPALVPFLLIAFSFGIFRLSTITLVILCIGCMAAYLSIVFVHADSTGNLGLLRHDLMQWCVLALTLPGMILVGKQIQNLRHLLKVTRYELAHFEEKASRDELTGLYNRRQLQYELERARSRASLSTTSFCICVIDIDHFKEINDSAGHLSGDKILREFAQLARYSVRDTDVVGRYGGDEFLQILPETDLKGAVMHAERLRARAQFLQFQQGLAQHKISLSIGVAEYQQGESLTSLVARADAALYRAKQLGRNRVEWEDDSSAEQAGFVKNIQQ